MDSPLPPDTAEFITATPAPDSNTSSPPPPTDESSTPPPSGDSSSPPPSENASPPPPMEETSTPPPSTSPPPASPPPTQESFPPPPSTESPPSNDLSQSPPPSENASPLPPSENEPKPPTPHSSSENNNTPPSIFSPPSHSSGSSQMPPPSKLSPFSPPPRRVSPSSDGGSSNSSDNSTDSSPNVAIIAGIAVAGVLILSLVILVVMCSKKKKRKPYYMDPGRGPPPGGDYYHGKAGNPWHSPQPTDHVVKLPPPPGVMGTPVGGGGGWAPPPGNASGEYNSGFMSQPHGPLPPPSSPHVGGNMGLGLSKSQFSYQELATATSGFAQANLLGQGGFGYVHKGVLPNGQVVAVKSLKSGSGQGEREFQAEVEIISRVHHRHLVSLVGYCIADGQRMLVYEFVPNSTLEFHLHGKGRPVMDFSSRIRIALGSAKGLAYLHEDCHPRIIHRDIKAANILLDDNYEAMVADFGLAKLSSDNFTHVSTRVMGTFGYLAPEYASSGKLSEKSDVFSFGIMLLELITGRRPVDPTSKYMEDSLVDWARPLLQKAIEDGDYGELADPRLEGNFPPNEMARLVTCAAASVRHSARRRPKMSQIVRALEGDASLDDLNENGAKPGQTSTYSSNQSADRSYDTCAYNADMMKFRKMVMDSQDFNSSQYGATSEYGLNPSSSSSESGNSGPHRQKL